MKPVSRFHILMFRVKVMLVAIILSITAITPVDTASAKAVYDLNFFSKNDIYVYNPKDVGCPAPVEEGGLVGSDNEEKVWNFLTQKGLSPEQIAGVMGNISHESGMRTGQLAEEHFGIVGWEGNGLQALYAAAEESTKNPSDLAFQLDYLYTDLSARKTSRPEYSSYSTIWDGLIAQKTVDDALVFFHNEFEGSFLLNFDEPSDSEEHKDAKEQLGKGYSSSRDAVIDQRGGYASSAGLDPDGHLGAQYFFITYGEEKKSTCSSGGKAVHPIADGDRVWEGYGGPRPGVGSTYCGGMRWHNGYDLNGQNNVTPVLSSMSGTVTSIDYQYNNLNTVSITHSDGFRIRYMHMNDGHINVSVGDTVTTGQHIGEVGTGNGNYGAHLHVEVDVAGNTNPAVAQLHANSCGIKSVNPDLFYKIFGVTLCNTGGCDNPKTEL